MAEQKAGGYSTKYRFTGKEVDQETGLYYFGARYYDPRISLWYGVDPLTHKMPAWSPYSYSFDNPIRFIDPDGRAPQAITPETIWDIINVGMGVASFGANVASGNVVGAVADGIGLAYDAFATFVPLLPAGGSAAIGAYRLTKITDKAIGSISAAKKALSGKGKVFEDLTTRLGKLENSINDHGKLGDVLGAIKEKLGIPLENPKLGGSPSGHIQEIEGTINSINKTDKMITNALKNKDLTKNEISIMKETQNKINELGTKYKSILDAADKAVKKLK